MVAYLSSLILKIFGWKKQGEFPKGNKYVILAAPHTSMWDFVWGRFFYNSLHKSVKFMVKEKYFFFPLGIWIRSLGAIPVIMDRKNGMVEQMVEEFNTRESFLLTITPEATRKRVRRWKKGFYHIAKKADVPIVLGYLDYKKRILSAAKVFHPTDDIEADLEIIRKFYENINAKHPEKYNKDSIY